MSQFRRLPSWPPLARCTVECEMNRCDMSAAFDRTDGRCYYCGKKADGKFLERLHVRKHAKYPWHEWLDGAEHEVFPSVTFDSFTTTAKAAAKRWGISVSIWRDENAIHLQADLLATRAA